MANTEGIINVATIDPEGKPISKVSFLEKTATSHSGHKFKIAVTGKNCKPNTMSDLLAIETDEAAAAGHGS